MATAPATTTRTKSINTELEDRLSYTVGNLKSIAISIGEELDTHNTHLDGLNHKVENETTRLNHATKRTDLVARKSNSCCFWMIVVALIVLIIMVAAIPF